MKTNGVFPAGMNTKGPSSRRRASGPPPCSRSPVGRARRPASRSGPSPLARVLCASLCGTMLIAGPAGCGPESRGGGMESARVVRVKRTAVEKARLIDPGTLGANGAADRRRFFFNFWNEQIIREDVAVGTVFMGDSITELWDLNAYFRPAPGEVIENRGVSGDLATVMARRFEADVIQLRPRNVVILAGTNDVADLIRNNKTDDEIISTVTGAIEQMMDKARLADIKVFVCSILPTNADYRMHEQRTELRARINERLQAACLARGCIYVDYAAEMRDAKGELRKDLARDGLHPHYAGYAIMARMLKAAARANGIVL